MSDSDEFGGLNPTTPLVPRRARSAKPGSSRPAPASKGGRRHLSHQPQDDSDIEELTVVGNGDDGFDGEVTEVQRRARKPPSRAETTTNANGKQAGKAKGKARAVPQKINRKASPPPEPMDVDAIIIDVDEPQARVGPSMAPSINPSGKHNKSKETSDVMHQLRRAEDQIAALSQQLEEVFQIRETEAEELLRRQETQYQVQLQAQESLIKQLTAQLALKEPLTRTGKTSILNLITREAADEEQRAMEQEIARWKEVAEERKKHMVQKDQRIAELEQREKELKWELNAEIDRFKEMTEKSSRHPPSASRGRPGGADDPKGAEIIRFYEDLTNFLVCNMKMQKGKYLDLEEWILSCVYTYTGLDDETSSEGKSLNFTLRCCHEPAEASQPVKSKVQLVPSVNYIPLDLDKEPSDYVQKLGFLGAPFTFGRDQLPLFLRTLYTNMGDAAKDDDEDSVQIVDPPS